ncbi:MAG: hypothetical protein K5622_00580 [Endomicrobiaceae bacterium]|nr:hypothetical protein [Endomicrobiaceae bacterium]
MTNEDLKSKYGRGNSNKTQEQENTNTNRNYKSEEEAKYGRNNTFTKKTKETLTQQEKDIKQNIADVISQYSQEHQEFNNQQNKNIAKQNQESTFIKIAKGFISFLILAIVVCIVIALIAKPQIDLEGDRIIDQIRKSEDLYYSKMHKYHYFSKTNYDQTLAIFSLISFCC